MMKDLGTIKTIIKAMLFLLLAMFLLMCVSMIAKAQTSTDTFWNSYYAARGGYGGGTDWGQVMANQRSTEALINEMRRQHGLPPCSIGLLGQWLGKPAC